MASAPAARRRADGSAQPPAPPPSRPWLHYHRPWPGLGPRPITAEPTPRATTPPSPGPLDKPHSGDWTSQSKIFTASSGFSFSLSFTAAQVRDCQRFAVYKLSGSMLRLPASGSAAREPSQRCGADEPDWRCVAGLTRRLTSLSDLTCRKLETYTTYFMPGDAIRRGRLGRTVADGGGPRRRCEVGLGGRWVASGPELGGRHGHAQIPGGYLRGATASGLRRGGPLFSATDSSEDKLNPTPTA